jgi:hypothetical protein
MELTYVTIVVLASMIFVLSGMVGYLYWQQTKMIQHLQSLALVLATHVEQTRLPEFEPEPEAEPEVASESESDDDRVSVEENVEVVDGPPKEDIDDLQTKTASELRDLLTKKGIPYGKRDSKKALLELLQATA